MLSSIFFFDAPIRSDIDKVFRYGMRITIWLYPIYLYPFVENHVSIFREIKGMYVPQELTSKEEYELI